MHTQRRGPAPAVTDASPVTAPGTPTKKPQTYAYYARTDRLCHPRTPVHFPVRTSNAAAWALFTLVVGTILVAACVLLTLGAPS